MQKPMTIYELREALKNYPDNTLVLVQGYEGGFSEISALREASVKLNFHKEEWNGPHEEDVEGASTPALILIRKGNPASD